LPANEGAGQTNYCDHRRFVSLSLTDPGGVVPPGSSRYYFVPPGRDPRRASTIQANRSTPTWYQGTKIDFLARSCRVAPPSRPRTSRFPLGKSSIRLRVRITRPPPKFDWIAVATESFHAKMLSSVERKRLARAVRFAQTRRPASPVRFHGWYIDPRA